MAQEDLKITNPPTIDYSLKEIFQFLRMHKFIIIVMVSLGMMICSYVIYKAPQPEGLPFRKAISVQIKYMPLMYENFRHKIHSVNLLLRSEKYKIENIFMHA